MKSFALSMLVALGVSLGAANALADTTSQSPSALLAAAQQATMQANAHAARAEQLRSAARSESQKAQDSLRIAADDTKLGFTYEAGIERQKAAQHMAAAQADVAAAGREDAISANLRVTAQNDMVAYQRALAASVSPRL